MEETRASSAGRAARSSNILWQNKSDSRNESGNMTQRGATDAEIKTLLDHVSISLREHASMEIRASSYTMRRVHHTHFAFRDDDSDSDSIDLDCY